MPGKLLRSVDGGATWRAVKAPRYPQVDYNGHTIHSTPKALDRPHDRRTRRHPRNALPLDGRGPLVEARAPRGRLRGAVVDQFAFTSDGRALALMRIGDRQRATFASLDGGLHWTAAPSLTLDTTSPAVYASPLAASGTTFLLGTNGRGFWRLGPDARRWGGP